MRVILTGIKRGRSGYPATHSITPKSARLRGSKLLPSLPCALNIPLFSLPQKEYSHSYPLRSDYADFLCLSISFIHFVNNSIILRKKAFVERDEERRELFSAARYLMRKSVHSLRSPLFCPVCYSCASPKYRWRFLRLVHSSSGCSSCFVACTINRCIYQKCSFPLWNSPL